MARYKFKYGKKAALEYSSGLNIDAWYDGEHVFSDNQNTVAEMAAKCPKEWLTDEALSNASFHSAIRDEKETNVYRNGEHVQTIPNIPAWGTEVWAWVTDAEASYKGTFIGYNQPDCSPYLVKINGGIGWWKHISLTDPDPKVNVTLQEIADWKGCTVEQLKEALKEVQ